MRSLAHVVDRMSASKLDLFERCPHAFYRRYVLGERSAPGVSQALGNAVDSTANGVYFRKLQDHVQPVATDVCDRFAAWWDEEAHRVPDLRSDDRGQVLDAGVRSVGNWCDRVAQRVVPAMEPQVARLVPATSTRPDLDAELGIASSWGIHVVVDLIADVPAVGGGSELVVLDHKASGKVWNDRDATRATQPPIYSLAFQVPRFQFHVLRTDLKEPRTMVVRHQTSQSAVDHMLRRLELARRGIARCFRSGDWTPHRNQALCSRRWCSHWQGCERDNGGTVP